MNGGSRICYRPGYCSTRPPSPRKIAKRDHLSENKGFDITVNGVVRTFRDRREAAYDAARYLKSDTRKTLSRFWIVRLALS